MIICRNFYRVLLSLQHSHTIRMSQSKISNYFRSPLGEKSKVVNSCSGEPNVKKARLSNEVNGASPKASDEKSNLSDVERSKLEENKTSAKLKLLGSKTGGLVVNIGPSWFKALEPEFSKEYFLQLSQFVCAERKRGTVYPPPEQVFTWTTACGIRSVKVVIIGQDPYHGPKQAHGLCFSVVPGVRPPPSLDNMFKELQTDIKGFKIPDHGSLIGWAQQGVLLLNACLTVRAGQANSHAGKGWEKFTDAVIQWLNSNLKGVVFMQWGAYAQKKGACIDKKKHHVLTAVHPSPLSAHRGFFGCKHFSRCNELLKADGKPPIDWTDLPKKI